MSTLPPDVAAFILDNIRSIDELHILVTCIRTRDRWWDARSMGAELGMPTGSAERAFESLARENLLDVRIAAEVLYRFGPGIPDLEEAALLFAATYLSDPVAVTRAVREHAGGDLQDFADAFRIRRHDDR
jgi:hypothetical protein